MRPILEAHCFECHGPKKSRGRLRLDLSASAFKGGDTRAPRSSPSDADESLMVRRVLGLDGEDRMPLDKPPLPDAQIGLSRSGSIKAQPGPTMARRPAQRRHTPRPRRRTLGLHRPADANASARSSAPIGHATPIDRLRARAAGEGGPAALARGQPRQRCCAVSRWI